MVRSLFVVALAVSLGICGLAEIRARQKYDATRQQIAARRAELQKLADIDRQVRAFQKQKNALQRRLDIIDRIKRAAH